MALCCAVARVRAVSLHLQLHCVPATASSFGACPFNLCTISYSMPLHVPCTTGFVNTCQNGVERQTERITPTRNARLLPNPRTHDGIPRTMSAKYNLYLYRTIAATLSILLYCLLLVVLTATPVKGQPATCAPRTATRLEISKNS